MPSKYIKVPQRSDYTFKYNQKLGRHGWLRLTPAYSVKLVSEIIANIPQNAFIIDPFSGTATTGLVAAQHNLKAHCFDINPFLIWLGNAKCRNYTKSDLFLLKQGVDKCLSEYHVFIGSDNWIPDIHNINRWWCRQTLDIISAFRCSLVDVFGEPQTKKNSVASLAWIAFCRLIIETSSAAFNHVSMSFSEKITTYETGQIEKLYKSIIDLIIGSANNSLNEVAHVFSHDARTRMLTQEKKYSHVVTSPPYPNRMSYIRELRPYMYWTKFLHTAREAGEIDWQAIGGTWGIATSRLQHWSSDEDRSSKLLETVISQIETSDRKNSLLMSKYVEKYFYDMHCHLRNLRFNLQSGATLSYIVGNSSFYGVQVHTEKLLSNSLEELGYTDVESCIVRKRNSKKELYEYCVSATWNN